MKPQILRPVKYCSIVVATLAVLEEVITGLLDLVAVKLQVERTKVGLQPANGNTNTNTMTMTNINDNKTTKICPT